MHVLYRQHYENHFMQKNYCYEKGLLRIVRKEVQTKEANKHEIVSGGVLEGKA